MDLFGLISAFFLFCIYWQLGNIEKVLRQILAEQRRPQQPVESLDGPRKHS